MFTKFQKYLKSIATLLNKYQIFKFLLSKIVYKKYVY